MRKTVLLLVGLVVSGIFLLSGAVCTVNAATLPSGNICWTVKQTQTEKGSSSKTFSMALHLAAIDSTVGTAAGTVTISGENSPIVTGTYFKSGSYVYMNLTMTQNLSDGTKETGLLQAKVSISTLKGTFFAVFHQFDPSSKTFDDGYAAGTLTKTTCS